MRSIALLTVMSLHSMGQQEWKVPAPYAGMKNPLQADSRRGKELYASECASCHGASGRGDGPDARELEKPAADLVQLALDQSDGALFWKITTGRKPMPAFRNLLSEEERWQIVHRVRELSGSGPPLFPEFDVPANARGELSQLTSRYDAVRGALSRSDAASVTRLAARVLESVETLAARLPDDLPEDARTAWVASASAFRVRAAALAKATDLTAQRGCFADLSDALLEALTRFGHAEEHPLILFRSDEPASGRKPVWIQRDAKPGNPYGGSASEPRIENRLWGTSPAGASGN